MEKSNLPPQLVYDISVDDLVDDSTGEENPNFVYEEEEEEGDNIKEKIVETDPAKLVDLKIRFKPEVWKKMYLLIL